MPEEPSNLTYSDVTANSVALRWTSGFDMGSKQKFYTYNWNESTMTFQKLKEAGFYINVNSKKI